MGTTVTNVKYSNNEANSSQKMKGKVVCPHSSAHTKETLQELKFEAPIHPPYSPDIAPSDFHLFGSLKEALKGC
jgi:hypothetical protein